MIKLFPFPKFSLHGIARVALDESANALCIPGPNALKLFRYIPSLGSMSNTSLGIRWGKNKKNWHGSFSTIRLSCKPCQIQWPVPSATLSSEDPHKLLNWSWRWIIFRHSTRLYTMLKLKSPNWGWVHGSYSFVQRKLKLLNLKNWSPCPFRQPPFMFYAFSWSTYWKIYGCGVIGMLHVDAGV